MTQEEYTYQLEQVLEQTLEQFDIDPVNGYLAPCDYTTGAVDADFGDILDKANDLLYNGVEGGDGD